MVTLLYSLVPQNTSSPYVSFLRQLVQYQPKCIVSMTVNGLSKKVFLDRNGKIVGTTQLVFSSFERSPDGSTLLIAYAPAAGMRSILIVNKSGLVSEKPISIFQLPQLLSNHTIGLTELEGATAFLDLTATSQKVLTDEVRYSTFSKLETKSILFSLRKITPTAPSAILDVYTQGSGWAKVASMATGLQASFLASSPNGKLIYVFDTNERSFKLLSFEQQRLFCRSSYDLSLESWPIWSPTSDASLLQYTQPKARKLDIRFSNARKLDIRFSNGKIINLLMIPAGKKTYASFLSSSKIVVALISDNTYELKLFDLSAKRWSVLKIPKGNIDYLIGIS